LRKWGDAPRGDDWHEGRVRLEVANLRERFSKMVCCNLAAGVYPPEFAPTAEERSLWPLINDREAKGDLRASDYLDAKGKALAVAENVVGYLASVHPLSFPARAEVWPDRLFFHKNGHCDLSRTIALMFAAACPLLANEEAARGLGGGAGSEPDWIDSGTAASECNCDPKTLANAFDDKRIKIADKRGRVWWYDRNELKQNKWRHGVVIRKQREDKKS